MNDKQLSNEESFKLISNMIYQAKGYFYESGISALVYGFSILLCTLLTYLKDTAIIRLPFPPLYLLITVFFVQAFIQLKEEKKKKAKTFTDEAIDFVWLGFFLSVIASLSGSFAYEGYIIITIILFLAGFATFITGLLAKFRYHVVTGFFCLIMAAISFFIQNENIYFFLAAASILVWIIPGFIIRAYLKKKQHD